MKHSSETMLAKIKGNIDEINPVFFIIWKFLSPGQYKPVYKSEI